MCVCVCVCVKESIADCQRVLSQKKISAAEREIAFSFAFKTLNYPHQDPLGIARRHLVEQVHVELDVPVCVFCPYMYDLFVPALQC